MPQATLPLYDVSGEQANGWFFGDGSDITIELPDDSWTIAATITKAILKLEACLNYMTGQEPVSQPRFTVYIWKNNQWQELGYIEKRSYNNMDWKTVEIDVTTVIQGLTLLKYDGKIYLPKTLWACTIGYHVKASLICDYETGNFEGTGVTGTLGTEEVTAIFGFMMQFMMFMMVMGILTDVVGGITG